TAYEMIWLLEFRRLLFRSSIAKSLLSMTAKAAPESNAFEAYRFPSKFSPLRAKKMQSLLIFLVSVQIAGCARNFSYRDAMIFNRSEERRVGTVVLVWFCSV